MVINEMTSKIQIFVEVTFVGTVSIRLLFVGTVFVSSIMSSHIITESSIILAMYLPFLQLHTSWFQIQSFAHVLSFFEYFHTHRYLSLFHFWFKLHFIESNLHSHLHNGCFASLFFCFCLFILAMILKTPY